MAPGSERGRLRKRRASSATSWKSRRPQLSRMTSSRSPCSPVAASVLCAVEHKTEYVAARVMLRRCDWALSHDRSSASTQHNLSASAGGCVMPRDASELARRLARDAEAVCRHYLSNGRRQGRYWTVGDVRNTPGRSMFVRLSGPESGPGAAGHWTDAASAEHGDLLDVIRESCGLVDFRDVAEEARRFLALPRAEPRGPASPFARPSRPGRRKRRGGSDRHVASRFAGTLGRDLPARIAASRPSTMRAHCGSIRAATIARTTARRPRPGRR